MKVIPKLPAGKPAESFYPAGKVKGKRWPFTFFVQIHHSQTVKVLTQSLPAPPRPGAEGCISTKFPHLHQRTFPSAERVTTWKGMAFPLARQAIWAACWSPPQQGTCIRTTVRLRMSLPDRIWVSFAR